MHPKYEMPGRFPNIKASVLPTPMHKLKKISELVSANIYCKRDDLTGFAFGGNKTRKLDFLIGDALEKKAETLVAVGAVQSNFCRMAAAYAEAGGMEAHLVLGGKRPEKPTGNLLLDYLFGARVHFVETDDWTLLELEGKRLAAELGKGGKNVCSLPVGGSTPLGALGYAAALLEILDDGERLGIDVGTVVHASSSGGTQAGLIVGKKFSGWRGKIIGMGVAKTRETLSAEVLELARGTGKLFQIEIDETDVTIDSSYMGETYGARTAGCEEAKNLFARKEGIVLDNVYTGKAAAGVLDYARRGMFGADENIVFIHTGGNVEIFE